MTYLLILLAAGWCWSPSETRAPLKCFQHRVDCEKVIKKQKGVCAVWLT